MPEMISDDALNKLLKDAENEIVERVDTRIQAACAASNILATDFENADEFEALADRILAWIRKRDE